MAYGEMMTTNEYRPFTCKALDTEVQGTVCKNQSSGITDYDVTAKVGYTGYKFKMVMCGLGNAPLYHCRGFSIVTGASDTNYFVAVDIPDNRLPAPLFEFMIFKIVEHSRTTKP
jgi:hypothetical protein